MSGRPSLTTHRSDRLHVCRAKAGSFTPASVLRQLWPLGSRVCVPTILRSLHNATLRAGRVAPQDVLD